MACPRCGLVHKPWQCQGVTKPRDKVASVTKAVTELVTPSLSLTVMPAEVHEALLAEFDRRSSLGAMRGRPRKDGPVSASTERKRRQRARQRGGT